MLLTEPGSSAAVLPLSLSVLPFRPEFLSFTFVAFRSTMHTDLYTLSACGSLPRTLGRCQLLARESSWMFFFVYRFSILWIFYYCALLCRVASFVNKIPTMCVDVKLIGRKPISIVWNARKCCGEFIRVFMLACLTANDNFSVYRMKYVFILLRSLI